jgi:hypothetical protein
VADFDGDGKPDEFIVYAHPLAADESAEGWHIVILFDNGAGNVRGTDLKTPPGTENLGAVAAFDANHDGLAEALVLVHQGASNDFTRLYEFWDTAVVPVRGPGGKPFEFSVGADISMGSGGGCRQQHGTALAYTSAFWEHANGWHWQRTYYQWGGTGNLRLSKVRTEHGLTTEMHDSRYAAFNCLNYHLGDSTVPATTY